MHRQGLAATQRTEHGRMSDFSRWHIQCPQLAREFFRVIDQRQQIGQWDQLAVVENAPTKLA
jgi:hypothetical protein